MSVISPALDAEKQGPSPLQYDSDVTLTNSSPLSRHASRESSVERIKKGQMESLYKGASTTRQYFNQQLDSSWMSSILIVCFLTSGLIDSVSFNSWSCFVGMQTGNTIFGALGIGGQPRSNHPKQYHKSLVAIGSFCVGALFFNALHRIQTGLCHPTTSRRRWILALSFLIQTLFVCVAALLVELNLVSNQPAIHGAFSSGTSKSQPGTHFKENYLDLCPIAFLAFEAAGQVALSRVILVGELPTIVLSTLYHDFFAAVFETFESYRKAENFRDFLFNYERRQAKRLMSICALFCGGLIGGEMYKSSIGMSGALWFAAGLKGACVLALVAWKKDPSETQALPK